MAELEFVIEAPEKGRVLAFPSKAFIIGSDPSCAVCFKSELISDRHAEVMMDTRGQWWVRDLAGSGAVAVNNVPIIDERIAPGDRLRVGDHVLLVRDSGVNAHARTRSGDRLPAVTPRAPVALGDEPPRVTELGPDVVIDNRYKIVSKLAEGGMGEVYKAVHVELGKQLALKVMLPDLSNDQEFVGRFKREAIASSRIGHPNIIDISDFGRTPDGRFYFVMEYVDGKTLVRYRREGPFRFERVLHVGLQAARALAAAHSVGIVHRDLKPENIMLVQRPGQPDFVKLLDFGIAKQMGAGASGQFTAIGSVVGTPQYMAPEQASGGVVDHRSDIYSLGLILHELVRGRPTFTGDSAVELMSRQLDTPPPPLRSPWGTVPAPLERIIMQMLEKGPEQRPASMEAVISALEAAQSTPTPARTEPITALNMPGVTQPEAQQSALGVLTPPEVPQPTPSAKKPLDVTRVQPPTDPGRTHALETRVEPSRGFADEVTEPEVRSAPPSKKRPAVDSGVNELAAVRPSRLPLIIVAFGVVGLLVGGVAWTFSRGGPEAQGTSAETKDAGVTAVAKVDPPAEVTPPPRVEPRVEPPPPAPIAFALESAPEHAEVFEADVSLGSTPLTLRRPSGSTAELRFELKGYAPVTRKVRFETNSTLKVVLEPEKKRPGPVGPTRTPVPRVEDLKDAPF